MSLIMHHAMNKDEVEVQLHSFLPGYSHRTDANCVWTAEPDWTF